MKYVMVASGLAGIGASLIFPSLTRQWFGMLCIWIAFLILYTGIEDKLNDK